MNEVYTSVEDFTAPESKILLIDDSKVTRTVERDLIKKYCNDVTTASSGSEALKLLSSGYSYDIIFIDYMMPDMDGFETAVRIKNIPHYKNTTLIMLTASSRDSLAPNITNEFTDFLEKPMNLSELRKILLTYLPKDFIVKSYFENEHNNTNANVISDEKLNSLQIENLNITKALETCGGSIENYYSILSVSYYDGENKLQILKKLIQENDIRNYTIEVHALKTVAALIGDFKLSKMAEAHEEAGKNFDYRFIENNFDSLYHEYCNLLENIKPIIDKENASSQIKQTVEFNKEDVSNLLTRLDDSIDNFDLDVSKDLLNKLFKYKLSSPHYSSLKSVRNYLNIFDYDNSQRLVKNIIDELK